MNDTVNEVAELFREADGLVLASPVYYASANATLRCRTGRRGVRLPGRTFFVRLCEIW